MSQALAEAGVDAIALLDRKRDLGLEAASELEKTASVPVKFHAVDVTDTSAIQQCVSKVYNDLGAIDIVINSAGVVE